jgi:dihydrofolate reductase
MRLSIIVAMARNRVIGSGGALPWRLSADLRRFKRLTMGHPIIMGRRTFESIGRPLPGRATIVVTRSPEFRPPGVSVAGSLPDALRLAGDTDEAFVIGGGQVFAESMPLADRLYLTAVDADVEGDTFFPPFDESAWRLVEESSQPADDKNEFPSRFLVYDRARQHHPSAPGQGAGKEARR